MSGNDDGDDVDPPWRGQANAAARRTAVGLGAISLAPALVGLRDDPRDGRRQADRLDRRDVRAAVGRLPDRRDQRSGRREERRGRGHPRDRRQRPPEAPGRRSSRSSSRTSPRSTTAASPRSTRPASSPITQRHVRRDRQAVGRLLQAGRADRHHRRQAVDAAVLDRQQPDAVPQGHPRKGQGSRRRRRPGTSCSTWRRRPRRRRTSTASASSSTRPAPTPRTRTS